MLFPQVPRLRKLQRRTLWSSGEIKVTTFQLSRVSFSQGTVLYTQLQKNWRTNWLLSRLNVYLALQAKGMSCLNRGFPIIRGRFHCDRYTALKISRFLCIIFLKLIEPSEINYSFFFFQYFSGVAWSWSQSKGPFIDYVAFCDLSLPHWL